MGTVRPYRTVAVPPNGFTFKSREIVVEHMTHNLTLARRAPSPLLVSTLPRAGSTGITECQPQLPSTYAHNTARCQNPAPTSTPAPRSHHTYGAPVIGTQHARLYALCTTHPTARAVQLAPPVDPQRRPTSDAARRPPLASCATRLPCSPLADTSRKTHSPATHTPSAARRSPHTAARRPQLVTHCQLHFARLLLPASRRAPPARSARTRRAPPCRGTPASRYPHPPLHAHCSLHAHASRRVLLMTATRHLCSSVAARRPCKRRTVRCTGTAHASRRAVLMLATRHLPRAPCARRPPLAASCPLPARYLPLAASTAGSESKGGAAEGGCEPCGWDCVGFERRARIARGAYRANKPQGPRRRQPGTQVPATTALDLLNTFALPKAKPNPVVTPVGAVRTGMGAGSGSGESLLLARARRPSRFGPRHAMSRAGALALVGLGSSNSNRSRTSMRTSRRSARASRARSRRGSDHSHPHVHQRFASQDLVSSQGSTIWASPYPSASQHHVPTAGTVFGQPLPPAQQAPPHQHQRVVSNSMAAAQLFPGGGDQYGYGPLSAPAPVECTACMIM
ncbi:hypothetical protein GGX14DRAFT_391559 [Mycena pura]|uniref:Uncharacterized protein n=1 Tax=Mycena pura TaxID=153505 RepID=A0AAD6YGG8_9AGAR|nr:hypothetical protein GGX14DRAFT_391559 [Mycena pura]